MYKIPDGTLHFRFWLTIRVLLQKFRLFILYLNSLRSIFSFHIIWWTACRPLISTFIKKTEGLVIISSIFKSNNRLLLPHHWILAKRNFIFQIGLTHVIVRNVLPDEFHLELGFSRQNHHLLFQNFAPFFIVSFNGFMVIFSWPFFNLQ